VRRWLVAWGPAAVWAAVLFAVSSRPTLPVDLSSGLDKVAHFGAYLVLGFLSAYATRRLGINLVIAIAIGWAYGVIDEMHQSAVPGRDPSAGDWLADAAGTVSGVALYLLLLRARNRSGPTPDFDSAEPTS
jgi:VanZ family protein